MVLQNDEFKIQDDGIWISKKALEERKQHYLKIADNLKPEQKKDVITLPYADFPYTYYLGRADVYKYLLKHFEPLEP